jgi:hypothetical protein
MFSLFRGGQRTASSTPVSRSCAVISLLVFALSLCGATLERLTLDEMSSKATAVIRGKVASSYTATVGATIYTHYRVQVAEVWKGSNQAMVDVMLPGGTVNGTRQSFAGVPQLNPGDEYVMFLWTGKSGNTQLLGLTQGLFAVTQDAGGETLASRNVSAELMLDSNGKAVQDQPVHMTVRAMSSKVRSSSARSQVQ